MADEIRKKLRLTTIIYWILLAYVVTALVWWFFSLHWQNEEMYALRLKFLEAGAPKEAVEKITGERNRNNGKYLGEGITFLVLIMVGAAYLYRSVRRQFRAQQQQQNFIMAITHELKTPLAVARLNLETIQRYQLETVKREKLLQMTLEETMRLDGLINNILISSQLDGRSYKISREELNFSDLVNDAFCQFAARYHERILIKNIEPDIDITGDPLLLKLLVSNLMENANKYSEKRQPITVDLSRKDHDILLQVKDEGIGISIEEKKEVFRKFYRVGSESTRKTKGTGLGLYLCKKIAEDHHATISIADNKPSGSNFIVRFSN